MKIKDLKPRMPVTIGKNESLASAVKLLADEEIGALVVYEPQGLAGVISERDIVRAIADGFDLEETEVCEYMTEAPVVSDEQAVVGDAISKMNESGIRHVVVTSEGDVAGMISMRDIVGLFGTHLGRPVEESVAIR
jgi:CBS domain-containing protein